MVRPDVCLVLRLCLVTADHEVWQDVDFAYDTSGSN